jgi:drug/metabolite transporter (DMT)-like permease
MRFTAWVVLIATLLLWSGNWIVARAVRGDVSPAVATVGRLLVVLVVLAPFAFHGLRAKWTRLSRRDWRILAGLGLAGGGPHLALQWLGLHYTTAASGILYLSTTPIFILLMSRPLLRERIRIAQWCGVAVSFCGVFLIASQGDPFALSFNRGDLMAVASMVMWAAYTVLLRLRRDPLAVIELLVVICAFGVLFMLPWLAWEASGGGRLRLGFEGALAVLYSAIGSLLLAYAGWSYVVARLGAARAGVTLHLMPAFGVLLSMLFLGEYPRWYHFAGIALVLAGVATSSVRASSAASSR